jgi:YD repeat-containing protein
VKPQFHRISFGVSVATTRTVGRVVPNAPQSPAADTPEYAYQYDDIGNRITSTDLGTNRTYTANSLNQYTLISNLCDSASLREEFVPQFDDDGNQTLIQTSTGVWSVQYNGENRPVLWTGGTQSAATNIVMSFDRMGRRVEYTSFEEMGGIVIDKGVEHTSIVANQCKCCEIMIVSREWREYESGGTEYGIAQVNLHNRSCEDLKNQAKLVRKIPGVSVSFVYESDS